MSADLRAAAIAARGTAYLAAKAYRDHARQCPEFCRFDVFWKCQTGTALQNTVQETAGAAYEALKAYLPAGTTVAYHGSMREHHGDWTVDGVTPQSYGSAYSLTRENGERLSDVRIESITVVTYQVTRDGEELGGAVSEAAARALAEEKATADGWPGEDMDFQWWNADQADWKSPLHLYAVCDGHDEATGYVITRVEHAGGDR